MSSGPFVEVVPEAQLLQRVRQLGAELTADYENEVPVFVGVLKGSMVFLADLVRQVRITVEIDFLSLTRFGTEGRVNIAMDTEVSLEDRHVVVVEDIVDTGLTLTTLRRLLEARGVASVRTVALLDKATRRIVDVPIEYRGFEVGDEFLLGYGLDWSGTYRNLRSLWAVMNVAVLADDPLAFAALAYGRGPRVADSAQ